MTDQAQRQNSTSTPSPTTNSATDIPSNYFPAALEQPFQNTSSEYVMGSRSSPHAQIARLATYLYYVYLVQGPQSFYLTEEDASYFPYANAYALDWYNIAQMNPQPRYTSIPSTNTQSSNTFRVRNVFGAQLSQRNNGFVLSRVNPSSVAWFFFFAGGLIASLHLFFVFTLALIATLAKVSDNDALYNIIEQIASYGLGQGSRFELYNWIMSVLIEENPVAHIDSFPGIVTGDVLPMELSAAIIMSPLTAALWCFALGWIAAVTVNSALRAIGGINIEIHDD